GVPEANCIRTRFPARPWESVFLRRSLPRFAHQFHAARGALVQEWLLIRFQFAADVLKAVGVRVAPLPVRPSANSRFAIANVRRVNRSELWRPQFVRCSSNFRESAFALVANWN